MYLITKRLLGVVPSVEYVIEPGERTSRSVQNKATAPGIVVFGNAVVEYDVEAVPNCTYPFVPTFTVV